MRRRNFKTKSRVPVFVGILGGLFIAFVLFGNELFLEFEPPTPSRSYGTPRSGRVENAKRLPTEGPNFEAYSRLGAAMGRNSVHEKVRQTMLETYADLYKKHPDLRFVYGETGWPWGGDFYPHKTHKNGLSVDFMVPVLEFGQPSLLPHPFWEGWGYKIDFDENGKFGNYTIDFLTIILHLKTLGKIGKRNGVKIKRIIFAPDLQKQIRKTKGGKALLKKYSFSKTPSWIRHDAHYHVDFE